jgi:hypothetical protein
MIWSWEKIKLCTLINTYKAVHPMFGVSRCCMLVMMTHTSNWMNINQIRRHFLKSGLTKYHTRTSLVMQKIPKWYSVSFLRGYHNGDKFHWYARKFRFSRPVALVLNGSIYTFCGLEKTRVQCLKYDSMIIEDKTLFHYFIQFDHWCIPYALTNQTHL